MTSTTTYHNIRIWDGQSNDYSPSTSISVTGDLIDGIGQTLGTRKDLGGLTAIPGFIDAHVHMTVDPSFTNMDEHLAETPTTIRAKMVDRAKKMIHAGITTARDLGGGNWLELNLRDRINRGELPGPRLLCAGQPLTSPGGHCHFWGGEAQNKEEILRVLQRQHEHGVDLIKIMATGGLLTPNSNPGLAQFSLEELQYAVATAHSFGYHVAAHCHGTQGIDRAAKAGVTTIEHCSWMNQDGDRDACTMKVINSIVQHGSWVSPTVNVGWIGYQHANSQEGKLIRESFNTMKNKGVKFIASTDAGIPNVYHHDFVKGLIIFADLAGLSAVETLQSATINSAIAFGHEDKFGSLTVGKFADILFVEGDPLANLEVLRNPVGVIARGVEHWNS